MLLKLTGRLLLGISLKPNILGSQSIACRADSKLISDMEYVNLWPLYVGKIHSNCVTFKWNTFFITNIIDLRGYCGPQINSRSIIMITFDWKSSVIGIKIPHAWIL